MSLEATPPMLQDTSKERIRRAIYRARELGPSKLLTMACTYGATGCLKFAFRNFRHIIADQIARRWDRKYGVDTAGTIPLSSLTSTSPNKHFGNECLCISPRTFDFTAQYLPGDLSRFTFVDMGAGKSRTLLLASRYNYATIVGVEFAKELVEYSRYNLAHFSADWQRSRDLQIVEADAAEFPAPDGPLVVFFYNPFVQEVFVQVLNNIVASLKLEERDCFIIYCSSSHNSMDWAEPLIIASGLFKKVPTQRMPAFPDAVRTTRFAVFSCTR